MLCPKCNKDKGISEFYTKKSGPRKGLCQAYCKLCWKAYMIIRRQTLDGRYTELKKDAKKNGKGWELTKDDLRELWGKPCTYCNADLPLVSLDRLDQSQPYKKDNIIVCCRWCNYTKGVGSAAFFYNQCLAVVRNMPKNLQNHGNIEDVGSKYEGQLGSLAKAKKRFDANYKIAMSDVEFG